MEESGKKKISIWLKCWVVISDNLRACLPLGVVLFSERVNGIINVNERRRILRVFSSVDGIEGKTNTT